MSLYAPFSRPLYVMLKPVGARCNLACRYCYYTEKVRLYKDEAKHLMSDELLDRFTREYIESQTMSEILFTWHGGEPLMRPLDFYRKALQLQQKYARGRSIDNCIQTNGTLLTEDWCRFFKENGWLVGVSIDGPRSFHDACRCNGQGEPSFERVMRGIEMLDKYGVEWNAMAVINSINADYPLEFYDFFRQVGCKYIQFTPVVERIKHSPDGRVLAHAEEKGDYGLTPFSVTPRQWGDFLCALFDEWVKADVGNYFIQLFDATLANWVGEAPGICTLSPSCGHASVMEWNGDVYACDHFVFPEYKLGNICTRTLVEMLYGEQQQCFGRNKIDALPSSCRSCEYLFACYGECPKNRFVYVTPNGAGENYLCEGYYSYFHHVAPYMDFMKAELFAGRPPSNVMQVVEQIKTHNPSYDR
ncbi:MAG: anaerobic sulfatase-maturation protein [Coprobacter sp.]|nr:anaerobic sulfatase-maturation protein [Coprobacter sp.]